MVRHSTPPRTRRAIVGQRGMRFPSDRRPVEAFGHFPGPMTPGSEPGTEATPRRKRRTRFQAGPVTPSPATPSRRRP